MAGFDPTHAVRFDLPRGSVTAGRDERHVLLPCAALDDLVLIAGPEAACSVGRALGSSIGKRIASRLGGADALRGSSIERVITDIARELAVSGLGAVAIERWGRALVIAVEKPAVADLAFLASILEGVLEGATDTPVRCVSLGREGAIVRVLVASDSAIARARAMLNQGAAWGDVLARLHPSAPKDRGNRDEGGDP